MRAYFIRGRNILFQFQGGKKKLTLLTIDIVDRAIATDRVIDKKGIRRENFVASAAFGGASNYYASCTLIWRCQ